jgi:hypothetical protein
VLLKGKNAKEVSTREVMTTPVVTLDPGVKVVDAMQIMTTKGIRHLPVLEDGALVGIVTLADLVRDVLADQTFQIDQLMRYVGHKCAQDQSWRYLPGTSLRCLARRKRSTDFTEVISTFGTLDILVNNAALVPTSPEDTKRRDRATARARLPWSISPRQWRGTSPAQTFR